MTLIVPTAVAVPFRDELVALIPKLRGHAMVLTRSSAEADDLVQEALLRAWRFRDNFHPGSNLAAWMHRILRNTFYTAAKVGQNTVQDVEGRLAAQLPSAPDQEWRIQHRELLTALALLTDETREVCCWCWWGGSATRTPLRSATVRSAP